MSTPKQQLKRAMQQHLVPCLRDLGFAGGLAGFRRLGALGVDVLVVHTFKGVAQLDAGRVKRRASLGARTVRQDWAVYAGASSAQGASRQRLETPAGKGVWRYDNLRAPTDFDRIAKAMTRVVQRAGVAFWAEAAKAPREVRAVPTVNRTRAVKALLLELLVPRLRTLGFAGSFSGSAGTFRRLGTVVELVSVTLGGESLLVQVASRKNGRRSGAKTPSTDFLMAEGREDVFDESYAEASPAALRALVRAAIRAIEGLR